MWRRAGVVAAGCVVVLAAGAGVVLERRGELPWSQAEATQGFTLVTPATGPSPTWSAAPGVLDAPATAGAAGEPAVGEVLAPTLGAAGLGGRVGVSVVDLTTGVTSYETAGADPHTPASTLKILTGAAALHALGPDHTFTTRVVSGPDPSAVTLVGGGDPTLTAGDDGPGTRLADLAAATAAALTEAGVGSVTLSYDATLFTGPAVDPDWSPGYVPSVVSPTTALAVDILDRPSDPSLDAAEEFAALLGDQGISVDGDPVAAAAPADGTELASVASAPLATVVEDILTTSDNDGAEVLARHVALAAGAPGTSADAGPAVQAALTELGLDASGATLLDGSGLARGSAVPATLITGALTLAAGPDHPELRAVVTGLPVAAFTGTLADRFDDSAAAGLVRAKTGTLTGVSALAGVVVAADGVGYAFAVLADDVGNTLSARAALDDVAAALAACGCA
ncbi:D-alanyl-D-alanine carboxypeptidase/D-alanyl-D-alanine endopeptidase [Jiangella mangrovi]|uniref:D-alanyl-D-alanine carboxypeptidase/D-alanyl-D-alanine-endopeptidase (Penicillin-binding protein 4) n=1 Tax=Jiangella mangrovi TaxID=1524084 RepID=A0A7W9GQ19_9ACTN|nr:D-alanyl-D-alanine carboxypeptidase/D-alanyl-D-alanine-endopeptidase [Jiangella mangrovi]MBB5787666.1 D-alanyl-D-alanine carboxypeptidase/D-alanyl-D-alanine-endopeptidase (penicillin-binding protein 4) [Jiangella mangrovi]